MPRTRAERNVWPRRVTVLRRMTTNPDLAGTERKSYEPFSHTTAAVCAGLQDSHMSSTRLLDSGTMAHAIDTPATHNVIDNVQDEESLRRECSAAGVTYILPGAGRFSRELSAPLSGLLDLLIITMVIVAVQEHVLGNNNISLSDRCSAAVCRAPSLRRRPEAVALRRLQCRQL